MPLTLDRLREAETQDRFMEVTREILKNNEDKPDLVKALTKLQNDNEINVLSKFQTINKVDVGYEAFFLGLLFNEWLLEITAPIKEILNCVTHIIKLSEEAGTLQAFEEYCKKDRLRSESALRIALEHTEFFPLLSAIITAGSTHDFPFFHSKALLYLKSESDVVRIQALWACARLANECDHAALKRTIHSIEQQVLASPDANQRSNILRVLITISNHAEKDDEALCLTVIEKLLLDHSPVIIQAAAHAFATMNIVKQPDLAGMLLNFFKTAKTIDQSILNIISIGLKKYFTPEKFLEALELVEAFMEKDKDLKLSSLDSFTYYLSTPESKDYLECLVTRWLLSGNHKLASSIGTLIAGKDGTGIPINADRRVVKSLPPGSAALLANKACAYLFIYPLSAASYIISMLTSLPPQESESLGDTLYYPLGVSYPGNVRRYMNELLGPHQHHVQNTLDKFNERLTEYHRGLSLANGLEELQPSTAQREIYHRKFHQEMSASFKESSKESLITQLMGKPSVILYGNSSINYIYPGTNGERLRQETPMHSITTSMEFPSLDYVDHNQLEYFLRIFKIARIAK